MTAEWMYPPGVGPLCGAELEAWYEDLQDILGSDAGGAKITRAPPCSEKEPEFLDVLESCSLTWLTDGQVWGDGVQRVTDEPPNHPPAVCATPPRQEERRGGDTESSGGGDLLPPEFFELLSDGGMGLVDAGAVMVGRLDGGMGLVDAGAVMVTGGYAVSHHPPSSPAASEEELASTVPDASSCSSGSQSPSFNCSPPSSPPLSPPASVSSRWGKRKRGGERGGALCSPSPGKKSRREREHENERKVQELTDQNERLKAEIERLGEEVQKTRRALIERLVNTRR